MVIEFFIKFIEWLFIIFFGLPVMFLYSVRVYEQYLAGDFYWEAWHKVRRRK